MLALIRSSTSRTLRSHDIFKMAVPFLHGSKKIQPSVKIHTRLGIQLFNPMAQNQCFHTSAPSFANEGKHSVWLEGSREDDSLWMTGMVKLEKEASKNVIGAISNLGKTKKLREDIIVEEKKVMADVNLLALIRETKLKNSELIISATSTLENLKRTQSRIRENISLVRLRIELFLPFRLAVKEIVEPQLSVKPEKIQEEDKGDNCFENLFNVDRDTDYSLFLKQLKSDVELGNLDSFLSGIGILNAKEFLEICEFALKGDIESYLHALIFSDRYYMEEEVSDCVNQFPNSFDREGILKLIGKVNYSESMSKNCVKMVDYLSKLI